MTLAAGGAKQARNKAGFTKVTLEAMRAMLIPRALDQAAVPQRARRDEPSAVARNKAGANRATRAMLTRRAHAQAEVPHRAPRAERPNTPHRP